jgi:CMP-N-acetylneuraminic acid synthetase
MRNEELAKDSVHSFYVCQDAYTRLEVSDSEIVIMLLPTSPLRTAASIQGCVNLLKGDVESVISAVKSPIQPGQLWVKKGLDYVQLFSGREKNTQSQDWEKTYCINGSIYVCTVETLKKYQSFYSQKLELYEMSEEESLDINTEREFEILEKLL